jgi:hypothetical protein
VDNEGVPTVAEYELLRFSLLILIARYRTHDGATMQALSDQIGYIERSEPHSQTVQIMLKE